ncbi:MAG: helix-turn-helix transcriptional regulator [Methanobrevibacter sp.]|nr:helix-turn-helix transcriptional regulator [Methanobrevibacter sp.]
MTIKDKLVYFSSHGFSVKYIAEQMGVDPSTLTKWLRGEKGITHKNEEKLLVTLQTIIKDFNLILEDDNYG